MTTSSAETALAQLGELLVNNVVVAAMPIVASTLADIEANPAEWTNPATVFLKGTSVLGQFEGALPGLENASVNTLASVVQAIIAAGVAKLAPATLPTPTQIALGLVDAATPPATPAAVEEPTPAAAPLVGQAPL